jgi:hypothetical protein
MRPAWFLLCLLLLWLPQGAKADAPLFYDYPIVNPYEATVVGTPAAFQASIPKEIPLKKIKFTVFPDRKIPKVFWYNEKLTCSFVRQRGKAPLIFLIAGTGGDYNTSKNVEMQKAFYQAGFHSIALPSPTHMNFIVPASESRVPGNLEEDARDLYRVMELAWEKVKDKVEVSEFYLTGYSLGGIQSAFVSKLDEQRKVFNFKKVLVINPPVNLYNSVNILDGFVKESFPGGAKDFHRWLDQTMKHFATIYKESDEIDFTGEGLYQIYRRNPPAEDWLVAIIGIAFRLSSSNMIFAADVMKDWGYIVPKGTDLSSTDSVTSFMKVADDTEFVDYFNEFFLAYFQSKDPTLTRQGAIDSLGLRSIEGYLRSAEKIGLMGNEDDIILKLGEVDYLREVFGERATIYPNGGHCGNMNHHQNVEQMIRFFTN